MANFYSKQTATPYSIKETPEKTSAYSAYSKQNKMYSNSIGAFDHSVKNTPSSNAPAIPIPVETPSGDTITVKVSVQTPSASVPEVNTPAVTVPVEIEPSATTPTATPVSTQKKETTKKNTSNKNSIFIIVAVLAVAVIIFLPNKKR